MLIREIYKKLCKYAPVEKAAQWDNCGIMCGDEAVAVTGILLVLDLSQGALEFAKENNINLIITHHPPYFKEDELPKLILNAQDNGICVISMHTNLDVCKNGVNDVLAKRLEMQNVKSFCADELEGIGRVGVIKGVDNSKSLINHVKKALGIDCLRHNGVSKHIEKIALICGSGAGEWKEAREFSDALVTADAKYHDMFDAKEAGYLIIDAGHYNTEILILNVLEKYLKEFTDLKIMQFMHADPIINE